MKAYSKMGEIIAANKNAGYKFFDESSMRFFDSQIEPEIYHGCVFITSESHDRITRAWTIRIIQGNGDIDEIGEFMQYESKEAAQEYARTFPVHVLARIFGGHSQVVNN